MRSPYGLDLIDSCLTCKLREEYLFCNLPAPALKDLESIKSTASYPKGAQLFVEGQQPRGVFVLCHGRAKLATSSSEGRTMILKIAEAGEVLGLSATVSGKPYEVTAELLEPSQANFIGRDDFLKFLSHHGEAAVRVAQQLSQNYHSAYEEIRSLGLSETTAEKFARLLLEWSSHHAEHGNNQMRLTVTLTHEEIAQLIGSSRETITRLFSDFKKKKILEVKGSSLIIRNKSALEKMVGA